MQRHSTEFGEPDIVYEAYVGTHLIHDEYWVNWITFRLAGAERPFSLMSRRRPDEQRVLHPSWRDYEIAYTTTDGVETFRPIRRARAYTTRWIYLDEQLVLHLSTSGSEPPEIRPLDDETRALLEDEELNNPERYQQLQDALRPRSLLGDAVYALLEAELAQETEAEQGDAP